jgi:hypothetical protein
MVDTNVDTNQPDSSDDTNQTPEQYSNKELSNINTDLKDIYAQLIEKNNENVQKDVQQTKFKQIKINRIANINYWLFILFYLSCLVLTGMLFYFSKSPTILAMSRYKKIAIILLAVAYPIWIQVIDQIVVFILRILYAFMVGVPYTKRVRQ